MALVSMNLSEAQIDLIERALTWSRYTFDAQICQEDQRVIMGLIRNELLEYNSATGDYTITDYGIKSYCATILTKYEGATHDRILSALHNYQRLFSGLANTIAND